MIEGGIEVTGRRGKRRMQLLGDLKKTRRYWKLEEKALDSPVWHSPTVNVLPAAEIVLASLNA
jgi:hypothetical protein